MDNREVDANTGGQSPDALPPSTDGREINGGKSTGPPQLPTIGFAALKRRLEEEGVRVDELASKRSRKSRMMGLPKISVSTLCIAFHGSK